jgi:hypothetical protein
MLYLLPKQIIHHLNVYTSKDADTCTLALMSTNLLDLKTIKMIYFIIFVLLLWVWLIAEFINAPLIKHNINKKDDDSTTQSNDSNP